MTYDKRPPIFTRRWFPFVVILLLAAIGFAIGFQKHLIWPAILLALLGGALGWLVWMMIRVAIFTALGAVLGAVVLGLVRSDLWFVGLLLGGGLGFWAGWRWHRPALWQKRASP